MDLTPAFVAVATLLNDVTFLPFAAGLVLVLTALLKRLLPPAIQSAWIAIVLQVLIWIAYVVSKQLGYGDQFPSWIASITTIAGALAGFAGSSAVATWAYIQAAAHDIPLIGYSRSPSALVMATKQSVKAA